MAAPATTPAARPGSASARTMEALRPPISAWLGMPRSVAATATWWPTATEPGNEMQCTASSMGVPGGAPRPCARDAAPRRPRGRAGGGPAGQDLEQVLAHGRAEQLGQAQGDRGGL